MRGRYLNFELCSMADTVSLGELTIQSWVSRAADINLYMTS